MGLGGIDCGSWKDFSLKHEVFFSPGQLEKELSKKVYKTPLPEEA